jgi:NAD(P)-dependent dehydrogenase (short-subunit alcohol dehydrogenase family)
VARSLIVQHQGIGFEAARHFLKLNASRLLFTTRSVKKGEATIRQLLQDPLIQTLDPKPQIHAFQLNLHDYKSILSFPETVKSDFERLDILLINAGMSCMHWETSPAGHEQCLQVNVLSNALLALQLLPLLTRTSTLTGNPSRLAWTGSQSQAINSLENETSLHGEDTSILEHFDTQYKFKGIPRYADTKLLSSMFVTELAKRVPSSAVIITIFCPGMVATNMFSANPWWFFTLMTVVG